jgi:hypothetical protein
MKAILRLGRGVMIVAAVVATSGALEVTGLPLFSTFCRIGYNLAEAQSEARKLRDKAGYTSSRAVPNSPQSPG